MAVTYLERANGRLRDVILDKFFAAFLPGFPCKTHSPPVLELTMEQDVILLAGWNWWISTTPGTGTTRRGLTHAILHCEKFDPLLQLLYKMCSATSRIFLYLLCLHLLRMGFPVFPGISDPRSKLRYFYFYFFNCYYNRILTFFRLRWKSVKSRNETQGVPTCATTTSGRTSASNFINAFACRMIFGCSPPTTLQMRFYSVGTRCCVCGLSKISRTFVWELV